jgi:hypothetical protein
MGASAAPKGNTMRIITLLFALTLLTNPANATPPQVVEVSETLLGVNDTHLFVLRRMDDNMGYHHITQTDVVLIARDRKTNTDAQIWPVMRVIDHSIDFLDFGEQEKVEILPLPDRINPFDILLWRKARPLTASTNKQSYDELSNGDNMITITTGADEKQRRYQLENNTAEALIRQSLNKTRAAFPAYFNQGGDMLQDILFDQTSDCKYSGFTVISDLVDGQYTEQWIMYMTCKEEDRLSPVSMFLFLPQVQ